MALQLVLGPVRLVDAAASAFVALYTARLAKWLAWEQVVTADQFAAGESQPPQEAAPSEGGALSEAEKLRRNMAVVRESLINVPELGMGRSELGTRRERHPFPAWVARLGGFQRALLAVLGVYAALVGVALAQRGPNLFELVQVLPSQLGQPMIGLQLHRALSGGVDWRSAGISAEQWANATRVLRDPQLRVHYERFGKPEVTPQETISDVLASTAGQFIFYGAWFALLLVLDATHARYHSAFQSGVVVLGVACFLDICVTLGLSDLRDNVWLARTPFVQWMTSFERQLFMRHFGVPPLIATCFLYSTYTFVDYDEHALDFILELLISTQKSVQSSTAIIEACRARREVLADGRSPAPAAPAAPAPAQQGQPQGADAIKEGLGAPRATALRAAALAATGPGQVTAAPVHAAVVGRQHGAKSAKGKSKAS
jgi:hypothetical protein